MLELATVLGIGSAFGAVVSAIYAVRSSNAARGSARIAEQQTQLSFVNMVANMQPPVAMQLGEVKYRWSTNQDLMFNIGSETNPGFGQERQILWKDAASEGLRAEVVVNGQLMNRTKEQMLLTFRNLGRSGTRYPLRNEGVFLVDGRDVSRLVIEPNETVRFTWVDRRTFERWRWLYVATAGRNSSNDPDLEPPRLSWRRYLNALRKSVHSPAHDPKWVWQQDILSNSGFEIVADSRMTERVSAVWSAKLARSPIEVFGRDEETNLLLWKLAEKPSTPIDDDVVIYRCHYDATLAQIYPPTLRHVPGRL